MLCNIFESISHYVTNWIKINMSTLKNANHGENSSVIRRKQLYHRRDTVMSHRRHLYHSIAYLFCILSRLGSNNAVATLSK